MLIFLLGLLFTLARPETGYCQSTVRLVENGEPLGAIVVSKDASEQLRDAAATLREYVEKASKARLPVLDSYGALGSKEKLRLRVWVGPSEFGNRLKLGLDQLDDDGFVIAFPDKENIVIIGPTDWGTEFGVYEFLEAYVGVRWLLPSPAGEYVPRCDTIDIPSREVRREPAFFSRQLSGLRGKIQSTWARRNRMHGRIEFHHNLFRLFPPEKYVGTHPELFPIHGGKRYLPPGKKKSGWQPCFSAPGIVEEAIRNICDYFSKNPQATSYSLGVNDLGGYCECERCTGASSTTVNHLGFRSASDQYFKWAGAVAEGVLKKYPDKWFGCLAYDHLAEPPSQWPIHPRLVPFITLDRMKWLAPRFENEGKKQSTVWSDNAFRTGWYDYIYGAPYCIPRIYFHKMGDYIRFAHDHGVRAMYAEAYPNWGEGPKLYVALKLQWNPRLNVETLLNEWYTCAVGEDAASDLAAYYRLWEDFWRGPVLDSGWFASGTTYLRFTSPEYLAYLKYGDVARARGLLESALAKTRTEEQKNRAKLLLRAFEYYEASALSYLGLVRHSLEPGKDDAFYKDLSKKRLRLVHEFDRDPVLLHPCRFDAEKRFERLRW
jgi:hypothetical protein